MKKHLIIIFAALVFPILIGLAVKLRFDIMDNEKARHSSIGAREQVLRDLDLSKNEGRKLQKDLRQSNELLKSLEDGLSKLGRGGDEDAENTEVQESELSSWLDRIGKLKNFTEKNPKYAISEFKYLTDKEWLWVTEGQMETEADYRKALAWLRFYAKRNTMTVLREAFSYFYKAHNGNSPLINYEDFLRHLPSDFDYSRYTNNPAGENPPGVPPSEKYGQWIVKDAGPMDAIWDSGLWISAKGITHISEINWGASNAVSNAIEKYINENGDQPTNSRQIIKYIKYKDDPKEINEAYVDEIYKSMMKAIN